MTIFYAVVEGDPLDSGGRVIGFGPFGSIQGDDGTHRRMTYLGQQAWCDQCKAAGPIVAAPGSPYRKRFFDKVNGRTQALGGDLVLCKCERNPRIVAIYGRRWKVMLDSVRADGARSVGSPGTPQFISGLADKRNFARRLFVCDSLTGNPLSNRSFVADVGGTRQFGQTDDEGYATIQASDEQSIAIHIYFSSPKRALKPRREA